MPLMLTPKGMQALKKRLAAKRSVLPAARPARGGAVKRSARRYIEERGWTKVQGATYPEWRGFYRTRFGSFTGRVEAAAQPKYYVKNPPEGLITKHSHKMCFSLYPSLGDKWYSVHWYIRPQDIDSGVMEIERMLREGYLLTTQPA